MSVFAVLSRIPNPKLEAQIVKEFPGNHYKLSSSQWLVCAGGTTTELSDKIGISASGKPGDSGSALVFSFTNYYGSETADLWEWLKVKMEQNCG
jgi:hypothetical protein